MAVEFHHEAQGGFNGVQAGTGFGGVTVGLFADFRDQLGEVRVAVPEIVGLFRRNAGDDGTQTKFLGIHVPVVSKFSDDLKALALQPLDFAAVALFGDLKLQQLRTPHGAEALRFRLQQVPELLMQLDFLVEDGGQPFQ